MVLIICMMTARAAEAALELCERGYKESANSNRFPLTTYLRYEKKTRLGYGISLGHEGQARALA